MIRMFRSTENKQDFKLAIQKPAAVYGIPLQVINIKSPVSFVAGPESCDDTFRTEPKQY